MVVWNCREDAIPFQKHNSSEKCQSRADDAWDADIKDNFLQVYIIENITTVYPKSS